MDTPGRIALSLRRGPRGGEGPLARTVNRVICYCDDCQAFAHQLGRADLLDSNGGTDIVQVAPASPHIRQGQDKIAALRLSPKGLYRWHARCCNTPVGNTLSAVPSLRRAGRAGLRSRPANSGCPVRPSGRRDPGQIRDRRRPGQGQGHELSLLLRTSAPDRSAGASAEKPGHIRFSRRQRQHPLYPVTVLSREQRDALRPLCGPRPQALTSVQ